MTSTATLTTTILHIVLLGARERASRQEREIQDIQTEKKELKLCLQMT